MRKENEGGLFGIIPKKWPYFEGGEGGETGGRREEGGGDPYQRIISLSLNIRNNSEQVL
jgi:hypothetical protein